MTIFLSCLVLHTTLPFHRALYCVADLAVDSQGDSSNAAFYCDTSSNAAFYCDRLSTPIPTTVSPFTCLSPILFILIQDCEGTEPPLPRSTYLEVCGTCLACNALVWRMTRDL